MQTFRSMNGNAECEIHLLRNSMCVSALNLDNSFSIAIDLAMNSIVFNAFFNSTKCCDSESFVVVSNGTVQK